MSRKKYLLALAGLPLALGGCSVLGLGSSTGTPGSSATPSPQGSPWIVTAQGSATPSPVPSAGTRTPRLPPVSFLPVDHSCAQSWRVGGPLIPLVVTPAKGSFTVTWPRQYGSDYRITAVPQLLVSGNQPQYVWRKVAPGTGCTVSATITGVTRGKPYIVWLDAPNTGYEADGTRHPYSGRSGVVSPL